jgi:myo-inositol-1(or 4)-monophosphatase
MYQKIINKIIELGDLLPAASGRFPEAEKSKRVPNAHDIKIETELANIINSFLGRHSIYAEEQHSAFVEDDNVWVIDPISNTKNFIQGMPHYSIVLSHLHKGEAQFALVYDPSSKELFTAEKGKGAFLNGKRIYVSNRKKKLFFLIGFPGGQYEEKILKTIKTMSGNENHIRMLGSFGVHYAYIACGRADVAISFNGDAFPEFAGKLLVEEAGGKFTDFYGGVLHHKTEGIIASNGLVHNKIKKIIGA